MSRKKYRVSVHSDILNNLDLLNELDVAIPREDELEEIGRSINASES